MKKFFTWLVILVVEAVSIGAPGYAFAAPSVAGSGAANTNRIINSIINNTPGVAVARTTGTGVFVKAAGSVTASGLSIPLAAESFAGAGRIAGMAARAIRVGGWVGVASVVIPWVADQYNIKVCPPPAFFCVNGDELPADPITGGWTLNNPFTGGSKLYAGTNVDLCNKLTATIPVNQSPVYGKFSYQLYNGYHQCVAEKNASLTVQIFVSTPTCPADSVMRGNDCIKYGPIRPATENEIGVATESMINGNAGRIGSLYDTMSKSGVSMFGSEDAVTVTASPVTAPSTVSTTTIAKPDGSIDTVKTTTDTTVAPSVQGGNLGNTTVSYPTTTTTTTTTTNNVTNISYTTTNITNGTAQSVPNSEMAGNGAPIPVVTKPPVEVTKPEPAPVEIPTDYNREVTQGKILDALTSPITAEAPTGNKELDDVAVKRADGVTAVTNITVGGTGLTGWLPTIKTTACVNPKVATPITGKLLDVNICDSVGTFSKFISAVISVFCLYGCIREVQSAMKA
jgi:hypothetical protein